MTDESSFWQFRFIHICIFAYPGDLSPIRRPTDLNLVFAQNMTLRYVFWHRARFCELRRGQILSMANKEPENKIRNWTCWRCIVWFSMCFILGIPWQRSPTNWGSHRPSKRDRTKVLRPRRPRWPALKFVRFEHTSAKQCRYSFLSGRKRHLWK